MKIWRSYYYSRVLTARPGITDLNDINKMLQHETPVKLKPYPLPDFMLYVLQDEFRTMLVLEVNDLASNVTSKSISLIRITDIPSIVSHSVSWTWSADITFTTDIEQAREANFHIIGVPTDIDKNKVPNLTPLFRASKSIGKILKNMALLKFVNILINLNS